MKITREDSEFLINSTISLSYGIVGGHVYEQKISTITLAKEKRSYLELQNAPERYRRRQCVGQEYCNYVPVVFLYKR